MPLRGTRQFIIAFYCFFSVANLSALHAGDASASCLNSSDKDQIAAFAATVSIEKAIGQILMLGVPGDYNTYREKKISDELDAIIAQHGVGFIIVRTNNYFLPKDKQYKPDDYLDGIISFNNSLQSRTIRSDLAIPLLIATDFESPSISSIKTGIVVPPSALSIGISQNKHLISKMGQLLGLQLKHLGIQVLLGPVLDVANVKQGDAYAIQDRCFASDINGVVATSSHYIKGLRDTSTILFGKHFPSNGSIDGDPHRHHIPTYEGSSEQLKKETAPLAALGPGLGGVMTSHIKLGESFGNNIATFSNDYISWLRKNHFSDQVIISDDLSAMGAIRRFIKDSGGREDYTTVALKAFQAGHDILLFSHYAPDSKSAGRLSPEASFNKSQLQKVISALKEHIAVSEDAQQQLRKSLVRILTLKAETARCIYGMDVQTMLSKSKSVEQSFISKSRGHEIKSRSESFLEEDSDSAVKNGDSLIKAIIKESTVLVNRAANFHIKQYGSEAKILFLTYAEGLQTFKAAYQSYFTKADFQVVPMQKSDGKGHRTSEFNNISNILLSQSQSYDLIVYTAYDTSDADLLEKLYSKNKDRFAKSVIIICLNNPIILHGSLLTQSTIITTATNHAFAYEVIVEVLNNKLEPKNLRALTVSLGDYGRFHNVSNYMWVRPADLISTTDSIDKDPDTLTDCKRILAADYWLLSKKSKWATLSIFIIILISARLLSSYLKRKYDKDASRSKEETGKSALSSWSKLIPTEIWKTVITHYYLVPILCAFLGFALLLYKVELFKFADSAVEFLKKFPLIQKLMP